MRIFGLDIARVKKDSGNTKPLVNQPTLTEMPKASVSNADRFIEAFSPANCLRNYSFMFHNIAEVQFPILYICRRIMNANFVLRKSADDSIVWADTSRGFRDKYVAGIIEKGLLQAPNQYMNFKEFVFNAFICKFLYGNQYIYADTRRNDGRLWENCDKYYVLQPQSVRVNANYENYVSPNRDVHYLYYDRNSVRKIYTDLMYHIIDLPSFGTSKESVYIGRSRLDAQKYPISNICAVYEARNIIYVKRGAMGLIVNQNRDVDGAVILTPKDKEDMRNEFYSTYGITGRDKAPVAIMDKPVSYIPIGMNIQELMPFEECMFDASSIAGAYGVDSNLIPRKDNPTYSNLNTAEVNVYNSVVIPEVKKWLDGFNSFLGLYDAGYYIDALWDDVSVLQDTWQKRQISLKSISDRCKQEFNSGLITLNDWRVAIGKERIEDKLYDRTLLEMSEAEINNLKTRISL